MEKIVYVDSIKGDNTKGQIGDKQFPFKTIDNVYLTLRKNNPVCTDPIKFICENGEQTLTQDEYENINIIGSGETKLLLTDNSIKFNNVELSIKIVLTLAAISEKDVVITNIGCLKILSGSTFDIVERKAVNGVCFSRKTIILNEGTLYNDAIVDINVNRAITFVHNKNIMKSNVPNVSCYGGEIFYGDNESILNEIKGVGKNIIKSNYWQIRSVLLYTTTKNNKLSFGNFSKNVVLRDLNLDVLNQPENQEDPLINFRDADVKIENDKNIHMKNFPINDSDFMVIINCKITSNIPSCFVSEGVKYNSTGNSELVGFKIKPITQNIFKINSNYVHGDITIKNPKYHIDATNGNITIKVPENLKLDDSELFYKRLDKTKHEVKILVPKCFDVSTSVITLDSRHPTLILYKDSNETMYIKYH